MSLDPFEARLQFLKLVRTLNASQQSIAKVVSFAVKYGARCAEDLWECVVDQVNKASLNSRINILYFLDTLAETSASLGPPDAPYLLLIERSLPEIVAAVVPDTREGILNARATRAILDSWRSRRVLDPGALDAALAQLDARSAKLASAPAEGRAPRMSRADVLRRIEEDRERQKRLRERMWILPIPPLAKAGTMSASPASPSPFSPAPRDVVGVSAERRLMPPPPAPGPPAMTPLDVEFEQMWEGAGELDEDDLEAMREWVSI